MRHEFAFFIANLSSLLESTRSQEHVTIVDSDFIHRLVHVVRMEPGDHCILFDKTHHATVSLQELRGKKIGVFSLQSHHKHTVLQPAIIALLPILKKESFEHACYNLTEMGVTVIQPVITKKIQRSWGGSKEMERITKIIIAAAEQSKNYAFPVIEKPITLEQIDTSNIDVLLYADHQGRALMDVTQELRAKAPRTIGIMVGPEGDVTGEEKKFIVSKGFVLCALTPTILRSYQAITLLTGCLRSLFTQHG